MTTTRLTRGVQLLSTKGDGNFCGVVGGCREGSAQRNLHLELLRIHRDTKIDVILFAPPLISAADLARRRLGETLACALWPVARESASSLYGSTKKF